MLINIPAITCTNKKKTMEIPIPRWMVRTFTEFILLSLSEMDFDPSLPGFARTGDPGIETSSLLEPS